MIYLSSFKLSDRSIKNPNIYPYNVFHRKDIDPFVFAPITVLWLFDKAQLSSASQ